MQLRAEQIEMGGKWAIYKIQATTSHGKVMTEGYVLSSAPIVIYNTTDEFSDELTNAFRRNMTEAINRHRQSQRLEAVIKRGIKHRISKLFRRPSETRFTPNVFTEPQEIARLHSRFVNYLALRGEQQ